MTHWWQLLRPWKGGDIYELWAGVNTGHVKSCHTTVIRASLVGHEGSQNEKHIKFHHAMSRRRSSQWPLFSWLKFLLAVAWDFAVWLLYSVSNRHQVMPGCWHTEILEQVTIIIHGRRKYMVKAHTVSVCWQECLPGEACEAWFSLEPQTQRARRLCWVQHQVEGNLLGL